MADPICRWRNSSVKQVTEFNLLFPLIPIERQKGREIVEHNWALIGGKDFFSTPYQLAAQMAVYYEDDHYIYPRFDKLLNIIEANEYMQHWGRKYYAPNPYTKSMQQNQKPGVINNFLVNYALDKGNDALFSEALQDMYVDVIGNTDILINMINNFMDVEIKGDKVVLKDPANAKKYSEKEVWLDFSINDKRAFFEFVGETPLKIKDKKTRDLQIIYYGAPGTGKSHKIKDDANVKAADEKNLVFRTTFHPDSDYSTFVGAYKPTMDKRAVRNVAGDVVKNTDKEEVYEDCITYSFVPQAFLQAYVAAWDNPDEKVFLVIEEINRGNCAQIFGDLFQLLDRGCDGFSEYPIMADRDLAKYLNGKDENGQDVLTNKDGIKDGKLRLPNNLYIWATMNTRDQSLFPIDSAFKRRWEWVYMPIDTKKENWYIQIGGSQYSWTDFLNKVNDELLTDETAEDKHLGFYFCKAENGIIFKETFVSKVLFYLWTDVFKVYGVPSAIGSGKEWSFAKFYNPDGSVNEGKVALLMKKIGVDAILSDQVVEDDEEINEEPTKQRKETLVSIQIPNHPIIRSSDSTQFNSFVEALRIIGIDRIIPVVDKLKYRRLECPVLSTEKHNAIDINNKGYSYWQEGGLFIIKGCKHYTYVRILEDLNDLLNLDLSLETR